jgi:hypothetical protein
MRGEGRGGFMRGRGKGASALLSAVVLGGLVFLGLLRKAAVQEAAPEAPEAPEPLSVFAAPSHVPAGESWVLLGSLDDLPEDLVVRPLAAGVSVLEVVRLSDKARSVRVAVEAGPSGPLLGASSARESRAATLALERGQAVPSLTADANFTAEDLTDGKLVLAKRHFLYGYLQGTDAALSAVRLHNRATGKWHRHEHALERERLASEPPLEVLDPSFVEPDAEVTRPDTDGDGLLDFEEEPEARDPAPEHLGVEIVPGEQTIDIVAVDEAGNASWRTIEVFGAFAPAPERN